MALMHDINRMLNLSPFVQPPHAPLTAKITLSGLPTYHLLVDIISEWALSIVTLVTVIIVVTAVHVLPVVQVTLCHRSYTNPKVLVHRI